MVTALKPLLRRHEQHYEANAGFDNADEDTYLYNNSTLDATNTSQLTISAWFYLYAKDQDQKIFIGDDTSLTDAVFNVLLEYNNSNDALSFVNYRGNSNPEFVSILSNVSPNINDWNHILISIDTNYGSGSKKLKMYLNDQDVAGTTSDIHAAYSGIYSVVDDWVIGAERVKGVFTTGSEMNGRVAELWATNGYYIDLDVKSNRRKFISSSRRPVNLGSTGELPIGTNPMCYMKGSGTGFNVNSGYATNFTSVGTLDIPPTTPSDAPTASYTPPSTDMEAMDGATMEAMDGTTMEAMDA